MLCGRGLVEAGALSQREPELLPQRGLAPVGRQLQRVEARRRHRQAVGGHGPGLQREPFLDAVEPEQLRKSAEVEQMSGLRARTFCDMEQ